MSNSEAIRGNFLFWQGSIYGGEQPQVAISRTADDRDCSQPVACAGLERKTIEIRGQLTDFGANHEIIIEGTISENANDKASWFAVSAIITSPGIYTLLVDPTNGPLYYEPELTWLRIRARGGEDNSFPPSIGATMAAFWQGDRWEFRHKSPALGRPTANSDYQAV